MTSRRLAPGERVDGVAVFESPALKESNERLELRLAQADQIDHPILVPCHFIAMRFPMNQVTDKNPPVDLGARRDGNYSRMERAKPSPVRRQRSSCANWLAGNLRRFLAFPYNQVFCSPRLHVNKFLYLVVVWFSLLFSRASAVN
jgi:hypothetical protein